MTINTDFSSLHKQPNSHYCFVCGRNNPHGLHISFYDNGQNEVFATYTVPAAYQGYPGIVHGGIVASMLDEVVGRVAMIGDHHRFMFSVKLEVKYRQPVLTETALLLVGRVVKLRGRLGKAVGEVQHAGTGEVLAEAELTLAAVPEEMHVLANLEALGWYIDA